MNRSPRRISLASLTLFLSACGDPKPATDPSATTSAPSSDPSASASTEAKEGESCGGAAAAPARPRTCAAGLTCKNGAADPTFPGKCMK